MGKLIGLEGVEGGELDCPFETHFFRSVTEGMKHLIKHRCGMSAGDHGSLHIYIDDEGNYRAFFYRYYRELSSIDVKTKKKLKEWLIEWFPKLNEYS